MTNIKLTPDNEKHGFEVDKHRKDKNEHDHVRGGGKRWFLRGMMALALLGGSGYTFNRYADDETKLRALALVDDDAGQALKVKKISEKIDRKQQELAEIEKQLDASMTQVVLNPEDITDSLKKMRGCVMEINELLKELKSTGFRINNKVIDGQIKEIDAKMKHLEKKNEKLEKIVKVAGDFLPEGKISIKIRGIKISSPTLKPKKTAQVLEERDGLKTDLEHMKESLRDLAKEMKEFSNNKYVNKHKKID
jgi:hypothetical protein